MPERTPSIRRLRERWQLPAPERRTRGDLLIALAIVVCTVLALALVWLHGDARGANSITATSPLQAPATAKTVPTRLEELWHADDSAATSPQIASGAVVTGSGGTVLGHDPATGAVAWRYTRNMPLCGVIAEWSSVQAVYRDTRGCSQVTQLRGSDGQRITARSSDADKTVRLSSDGTYVTSLGPTRLELWRWDLVRTLEYGRVDAPLTPGAQPRRGCALLSAASSPELLAVLEQCPGEAAVRLTVQNPAPKDANVSKPSGSQVLAEYAGVTATNGPSNELQAVPRVLAVTGDRVAVYLPPTATTPPQIGVFNDAANRVETFPLPGPLQANAVISRLATGYGLWTGRDLVCLDSASFSPRFVFPHALGPGASMADSIVVPTVAGFAVLDRWDGTQQHTIPTSRSDALDGSAITNAVIGDVILEQRGPALVALRQPK